ncbi:hypothetical protein ABH931_004088, partial [Streptacidiphilus sp. MAP12-33]
MTVASVHSSSALPAPLLSPEAREDLHRYAEAGGFTLRAETHPWYAAFDFVSRMDEARAASTVLTELRGRDVPGLRDAAERLESVRDLHTPATVHETAAVVAVLARVRATLSILQPQAYVASSDTLQALAAATATAAWRAERGVGQSWWHRARLGRRARALAATGRVRREDLHAALVEASTARAKWQALTGDDTPPSLPADLAFLDAAADAATAALAGLEQLTLLLQPTTPLEELPLAVLTSLLDSLAADEGTLYRLPRLRELHDSLTAQGFSTLLTELTAEQADATATTTLLAQRTPPAAESLDAEEAGDVAALVDAEVELLPGAADVAEADLVTEAEAEPALAAEAEAQDADETESSTALASAPDTAADAEPVTEAEPALVAEAAADQATTTEPEARDTELVGEAETEQVATTAPEAQDTDAHTEPVTEAETEPVAAEAEAEQLATTAPEAQDTDAHTEPVTEAETEPVAAEAEAEQL